MNGNDNEGPWWWTAMVMNGDDDEWWCRWMAMMTKGDDGARLWRWTGMTMNSDDDKRRWWWTAMMMNGDANEWRWWRTAMRMNGDEDERRRRWTGMTMNSNDDKRRWGWTVMTMNGINHPPPNLSGSVRGSIRIIKMGEAIQAPTPRPNTPYMVMLGGGEFLCGFRPFHICKAYWHWEYCTEHYSNWHFRLYVVIAFSFYYLL